MFTMGHWPMHPNHMATPAGMIPPSIGMHPVGMHPAFHMQPQPQAVQYAPHTLPPYYHQLQPQMWNSPYPNIAFPPDISVPPPANPQTIAAQNCVPPSRPINVAPTQPTRPTWTHGTVASRTQLGREQAASKTLDRRNTLVPQDPACTQVPASQTWIAKPLVVNIPPLMSPASNINTCSTGAEKPLMVNIPPLQQNVGNDTNELCNTKDSDEVTSNIQSLSDSEPQSQVTAENKATKVNVATPDFLCEERRPVPPDKA